MADTQMVFDNLNEIIAEMKTNDSYPKPTLRPSKQEVKN